LMTMTFSSGMKWLNRQECRRLSIKVELQLLLQMIDDC
jgi:hypothetical protein